MDCFEQAYRFLIEKTLARYGYTAEIEVFREEKETEEAKA